MSPQTIRLLNWASVALLCVGLALVICHDQVVRFWINADAGCWPWSPAEVEYHDGMTICPGQSARATIIIVVPNRRQDGI